MDNKLLVDIQIEYKNNIELAKERLIEQLRLLESESANRIRKAIPLLVKYACGCVADTLSNHSVSNPVCNEHNERVLYIKQHQTFTPYVTAIHKVNGNFFYALHQCEKDKYNFPDYIKRIPSSELIDCREKEKYHSAISSFILKEEFNDFINDYSIIFSLIPDRMFI